MKTSLFKSLYFQVLTAIAIGILLGHFYPEIGEQMKPLGDGFVKLIKMIIAPVIFCTVVTGIAGMESMKAVGRTGAVALLYFEIVSTIALIIGLIIVNVVQPGAGMNVDPATLDAKAVAVYADQAKDQGIVAFIMDGRVGYRHPGDGGNSGWCRWRRHWRKRCPRQFWRCHLLLRRPSLCRQYRDYSFRRSAGY